jgi:hypothetical protein
MYELAGLNASSIANTALAALGDPHRTRHQVVATLAEGSLRHSL